MRKFNSSCGQYYPKDDDYKLENTYEESINKLINNLKEINFDNNLISKTKNLIDSYNMILYNDYFINSHLLTISLKQDIVLKMLLKDNFKSCDAYNIINCTPFAELCFNFNK